MKNTTQQPLKWKFTVPQRYTCSHFTDEDGSGLYLVDFQKKVLDDVFEQRDRARKEEEERQRKEIEEEKQQLKESVPEPENEEDEW